MRIVERESGTSNCVVKLGTFLTSCQSILENIIGSRNEIILNIVLELWKIRAEEKGK